MEQREPFFTPADRKLTVLWRPREWRTWWTTEPVMTKVLAAVVAAFLGWGIYNVHRGNGEVGWFLVGVACLPLAALLIAQVSALLRASLRWMFRVTGVTAVWNRERKRVFAIATTVFWIGVVVLTLAGIWDYLSLSPTKSWHAFRNGVPADRVTILKPPHDCEFESAPIGSKNCHYEAREYVVPAQNNPDKQKSILVEYERVED